MMRATVPTPNVISTTFADTPDSVLADRLNANTARFAAYKTHYVSRKLNKIANDPELDDNSKKQLQRSTLAIFDRFQDAETQTTRARARTAKQFEEFMKPDNLRLFPNLRWVGTTSVNSWRCLQCV